MPYTIKTEVINEHFNNRKKVQKLQYREIKWYRRTNIGYVFNYLINTKSDLESSF